MKLFHFALFSLPLMASSVAAADSPAWSLDISHTKFGFSVPHLVVSSVEGHFREASAKISLDEADLTKSQAVVEVMASSIDTGDAKRDEHLRNQDFFDVKSFPKITFKSTKIVKDGRRYALHGDLTIRGVTRAVALQADLSAPVKTPWGHFTRAAKVSGKVLRSQFGLKWNKGLETGGVLVGDEVTLNITAEVTK